MRDMIEFDELDILGVEYREYIEKEGSKNLKFSEWIKKHHPDKVLCVDSVGVVMEGDFEADYSKKFIKENFEELAHCWFSGIENQVDFGIILECVTDYIKEDKKC